MGGVTTRCKNESEQRTEPRKRGRGLRGRFRVGAAAAVMEIAVKGTRGIELDKKYQYVVAKLASIPKTTGKTKRCQLKQS